MKRYSHNLSHTRTLTAVMGKCYPTPPIEVFPGDSFRLQASNLTRFLPQVAPTMHEVNIGIDTYQVPWRQLFDKIGLSWDDFLTGGEDGLTNVLLPTITIPSGGYEPGSLADFLGLPTNYIDPDTGDKVIVGAGLEVNALPVIAYMHVINENYRDQNFVKKFDLTKYQEFLDSSYPFLDASGNALGYDLQYKGLFPKAWSRDYFGRALPNTQRGPEVQLPIAGSGSLVPTTAPVITSTTGYSAHNFTLTPSTGPASSFGYINAWNGGPFVQSSFLNMNVGDVVWEGTYTVSSTQGEVGSVSGTVLPARLLLETPTKVRLQFQITPGAAWQNDSSANSGSSNSWSTFPQFVQETNTVADLSGVNTSSESFAAIIAFRLAARMQHFGEVLQTAGARAVEFTLAMFGVRIPDDRIQRPIFHGSFKLPVVFSEVLQTSSTDSTSPQGNLAGHGITGGQNQPIHVKVIEHGYLIHIIHVMPRSQFQNILPRMYLRSSRFDIPNPVFQHVGEQEIKRVEIYPNSANPHESFGYVPRYSELMHIPSTLHGHMKDTFLHWTMARLYNNGEPVLSAAWRYEAPSQRSFSVQDEDQMQICIGFNMLSRRPFARNPRPGIHIV